MTKERKGGAKIPPVLKGFEDVGDVPQEIRDRAEYVVKTAEDVERMKEELKKEETMLLSDMLKLKIKVVPVIVGRWKKRVELKKKPESVTIDIVDVGLEDDDQLDEKDQKTQGAVATVN